MSRFGSAQGHDSYHLGNADAIQAAVKASYVVASLEMKDLMSPKAIELFQHTEMCISVS